MTPSTLSHLPAAFVWPRERNSLTMRPIEFATGGDLRPQQLMGVEHWISIDVSEGHD